MPQRSLSLSHLGLLARARRTVNFRVSCQVVEWFCFALLPLGSAAAAAQEPGPVIVANLPDVRSEGEAVVSPNGQLIYFHVAGQIRMYDRSSRQTATVYAGAAGQKEEVWDLSLSPRGDLIAFTRLTAGQRRVMAVPLDSGSGLPAGHAWGVSSGPGDTPSISPDGGYVAYASDSRDGQELMVATRTGERARVLARSARGGIAPIRWAPDGNTIYFGENPWDARPRSTLRVSTSGGEPDTVNSGVSNFPGLSPDGHYLVTGGAGFELAVMTSTGHLIRRVALGSGAHVVGWRSGHTLILASTPTRRSLRLLELSSGKEREIDTDGASVVGPAWAPDGSAFAAGDRDHSQFLLFTPSGNVIRKLPVQRAIQRANLWSPDGRWILYFSASESPELNALEVGTGREVRLVTAKSGNFGQPEWLSGSDGVLLPRIIRGGARPGEVQIQPEAVFLDGKSRKFPAFASTCPRFYQLTDTTALVSVATGERSEPRLRQKLGDWYSRFACMDSLTVVRVADGKRIRAVAPPSGVLSRRNRSTDGRVAVRASGSLEEGKYSQLLLFRVDGTSFRLRALPFTPVDGRNGVMFLPGANAALVLGQEAGNVVIIYRVILDSGVIAEVARVRAQTPNAGEDFDLSPDGRTIAYVSVDPQHLVVSELDLGH